MAKLDKLIHQPIRLQIMATLVALDEEAQLGFTTLREMLDLSDGNLGSHLRKLEEAEYVQIDKTFVARKPQTFIQATLKGRTRFEQHVAALETILREPLSGESK